MLGTVPSLFISASMIPISKPISETVQALLGSATTPLFNTGRSLDSFLLVLDTINQYAHSSLLNFISVWWLAHHFNNMCLLHCSCVCETECVFEDRRIMSAKLSISLSFFHIRNNDLTVRTRTKAIFFKWSHIKQFRCNVNRANSAF